MTRATPLALALCLLLAQTSEAYEIPEIPADRDWIQDHAELITAADRQTIHEAMARSGKAHSTAIMVVTIPSMAEYLEDEGNPVIEDLAKEWFNTWEIGLEEYNTGMLLLVSKGDRKARIELGAAWGRKWDGHCQRIMDTQIVANFKQREFSKGIREGVKMLETMAALGPDGEIPAPGFMESLQNTELMRKLDTYQPLPMGIATISLLLGVGLVLGGFFAKDRDLAKWLWIAGGFFIMVGISLYLLMIVFGAFSKNSGGSSSSGFGGGGFSGGGGATGSW